MEEEGKEVTVKQEKSLKLSFVSINFSCLDDLRHVGLRQFIVGTMHKHLMRVS